MDKTGTKDAIGNEIIIGEIYGYSVDSNGVTYTTIGKVIKFTPSGKATLETIKSRTSLWMDEGKEKETSSKVSVKPSKLFPVSKEHLNL